jgi:hypothetical protein
MTNTRHPQRLLPIVASVVCVTASIAALAPAASAMIAPLSGGGGPAPSHVVRTILVSSGMPDWQVALITGGAALLGAAVAILIGWTRTRRQSVLPAS